MQFISGSLEGLVKSLKAKVRPCEVLEDGCPECGFPEEGHECSGCQSKSKAQDVFPRTYRFIKKTFGLDHLHTLLAKQVRM